MRDGGKKGGSVRGCFSQIDFSVHTFTPKEQNNKFCCFSYDVLH